MNFESLSNGTVKHAVFVGDSLLDKFADTKTSQNMRHMGAGTSLQVGILAAESTSAESTRFLMALPTGKYF
jgi:hypothetical protein